MICPLLTHGWLQNEKARQFVDCVEDECAWWDKDTSACAIANTGSALEKLSWCVKTYDNEEGFSIRKLSGEE